MSNFAEFKDEINRVTISSKLLGEVMLMYSALGPEDRGFETRAMQVEKFLTNKRQGEKHGLLAAAIMIRLMALDAILADREVGDWTLPGGKPGVTYVHSSLLRAAAEETVVEGSKGQPMFDPASFRQRVLRIAATGGRA